MRPVAGVAIAVISGISLWLAFAQTTSNPTVAYFSTFVRAWELGLGALVAIAADEIVMDPNAVLGPVDPQLGSAQAAYPAASIIRALAQPNPNRDDQTLILGDVAEKALRQVTATVKRLLLEHYSEADAERIANKLSSGEWTHD